MLSVSYKVYDLLPSNYQCYHLYFGLEQTFHKGLYSTTNLNQLSYIYWFFSCVVTLVRKQPPLPPPSPLLLILSKGAQIKLLLVEVLREGISTFS